MLCSIVQLLRIGCNRRLPQVGTLIPQVIEIEKAKSMQVRASLSFDRRFIEHVCRASL